MIENSYRIIAIWRTIWSNVWKNPIILLPICFQEEAKKSTTVNIFENNCPSSYLTTNNINKIDLLFNRVSESWWVKSFGVKHETINHYRSKNSRNKSSIDICYCVQKYLVKLLCCNCKKYFSTKMVYDFHILFLFIRKNCYNNGFELFIALRPYPIFCKLWWSK